MATSLVDADSLLAIDVGSTHTRAMLFDAVEDRYHLIAMGVAASTARAPFDDLREGIREAIDQVQQITGRTLVASDEQLIVPASDGMGVDHVVLTLSAGKPLQVVIAGVLARVSLQSARRLAETIYSRIGAQLHLNDRLHMEGRVNAVVKAHPDVVVLAGGLDNGATHAVLQMVEAVGLATYLIPQGQRPEVIFAGNARLRKRVQELLEGLAPLHVTDNLRPDLNREQIGPAEEALLKVFRSVRQRQMPGLQDWLAPLAGRSVFYPTSYGLGRMVNFLSRIYDPSKGVLGVDVGAEATTLAAGWGGEGVLKTFSFLGLGSDLPELLRHTSAENIARWLPVAVPRDAIVDYLYNKALHPDSIPVTEEDLAVEQALARQVLRVALGRIWRDFPTPIKREFGAQLPYFEPILASGSIFTRSATPGQALLMLLDGIQPSGITTFVLDANHLLPALGAAADLNPILSVQVLESHHFVPLATVITPVHHIAKPGVPILRLKVETEGGESASLEIKTGALRVLRLRPGQTAQVHVRPLRRADAGFGPGRRGTVTVNGSTLGLVIDARGRPIVLASDPAQRREQNDHWLQTLGG